MKIRCSNCGNIADLREVSYVDHFGTTHFEVITKCCSDIPVTTDGHILTHENYLGIMGEVNDTINK